MLAPNKANISLEALNYLIEWAQDKNSTFFEQKISRNTFEAYMSVAKTNSIHFITSLIKSSENSKEKNEEEKQNFLEFILSELKKLKPIGTP